MSTKPIIYIPERNKIFLRTINRNLVFQPSASVILEDVELHKRIDDMRLEVELEQENYRTALLNRLPFAPLKQMRINIKKLKDNLRVLVDQQTNGHTRLL